jgi:hypothetical protein
MTHPELTGQRAKRGAASSGPPHSVAFLWGELPGSKSLMPLPLRHPNWATVWRDGDNHGAIQDMTDV